MIADIVLSVMAILLQLLHGLLSPFTALFNWLNVSAAFDTAVFWLLTPLRYAGYWFDLAYLGQVIIWLGWFLSLWYGYQLVRMAISLKSGEIEHPSLD